MSGTTKRALLPVALVMIVTALVVLVATLAASGGPTQVFEGVGPTPNRITTSEVSPSETLPAGGDTESDVLRLEGERGSSLTWLGPVVRGLLLALVVVSLALYAYFALRRRRPRRRAADDRHADPDFALVDPVAAVTSALVEDADDQDAALATGSPRNGIVEAWLRFEVQAERGGVPRKEWETSSEFTERFLDTVRADPEATALLADLYRLARFSDHELGEAERVAAASALTRIRQRSGPGARTATP